MSGKPVAHRDRPWDEADIHAALAMDRAGVADDVIADRLDRHKGSVVMKLYSLTQADKAISRAGRKPAEPDGPDSDLLGRLGRRGVGVESLPAGSAETWGAISRDPWPYQGTVRPVL